MTALRRAATAAAVGCAVLVSPAAASGGWVSAAHPGGEIIGAAHSAQGAASVLHRDVSGPTLLSLQPARGPWRSPPQTARPPAGISPVVAGANDRGTLLVLGPSADGGAVAASSLRDGLWSAPQQVLPAGATPLQVVLNDRSDAAAVARTAAGIALVARDAGPNWDDPAEVPVAGEALPAVVALSRQGHAVAVWAVAGDRPGLASSGRRPGGVWTAPTLLDLTGFPPQGLALVVDDEGVATAVWSAPSGDQRAVWTATRPATGAWSEATIVPGSTGGTAPAVAVDGAGVVTAAWGHQNQAGVASAHRPPHGPWSRPIAAGALTGPGGQSPQLAVNVLGQAVASWGGGRIARRGAAGNWGPAHAVLPVSESGASAALRLSRTGDTLAGWNDGGLAVLGSRRGDGRTALRALRAERTAQAPRQRRVQVRVRANVAGPALITLRRNRDGRLLWAATVRLRAGWSTHTAPAGVAGTPTRGRHTVTVLSDHRTISHARRTASLP